MGRFLMALLASVCALGCGGSDDAAPAGATVFTLTAAGGAFAGEGALAGVALVVPEGAVEGEHELWMAPPAEERPLPSTGRMVGPEVLFGPEEVVLLRPAELTLPFEASRATAAGAEIDAVKVWRVGPDGWALGEPVGAPGEGRVTASVERLSRFGAGVVVE